MTGFLVTAGAPFLRPFTFWTARIMSVCSYSHPATVLSPSLLSTRQSSFSLFSFLHPTPSHFLSSLTCL